MAKRGKNFKVPANSRRNRELKKLHTAREKKEYLKRVN